MASTINATSTGSGGLITTGNSVNQLELQTGDTTRVVIDSSGNVTIQGQGDLRLADSDSSHYVALQAPGSVASNVTFTLPSADGTSGQVLQTNGSGTLSFATPAAGAVEFITSVTASNSATVNFNSTYITSTYDVYMLQISGVSPATDDVSITIDVSANNGSSFPYSWNNTGAGYSSNGSTVQGVGGGQNRLTGGLTASGIGQGLSSTAGEKFNCTMYIYQPSAANKFQCTWNASWIAAPSAAICWVGMAATNNSATAINYIRFAMESGNISSGTFRLYGIKNS